MIVNISGRFGDLRKCCPNRTLCRAENKLALKSAFSCFSLAKKMASERAIILTEILVALGVLGIFTSASLWALIMVNNQAAVARLLTGAQTVAQNQMDLVLSDSPFNPQKSQTPPELVVGTQTQTNVAIYLDPVSNQVVNTATMTTVVTDTATTLNGYSLNVYTISVTITFSYKNRNFSVSMSTMRASDV